jgi:hypothetical protein
MINQLNMKIMLLLLGILIIVMNGFQCLEFMKLDIHNIQMEIGIIFQLVDLKYMVN